mgnify:CR=1 FL=1
MSYSIFITGASSGIGKALAFEMARRGYDLGLAARRLDKLEELREALNLKYPDRKVVLTTLDVTEYERIGQVIREAARELGGIDIVFANAGVALAGRVGRDDFKLARQTIETNLIGAMATVDAAVNYFLERGKGHIVATSSVAAFRGLPGNAAYCASKAGLTCYMEALRAEVHGKPIDITVLHPGFIDTPLNDMLPNRPFLISAGKGAAIIGQMIAKKVKSATVPVFPWNIIKSVMQRLPIGLVAKMK